jgi:hypothetical protein
MHAAIEVSKALYHSPQRTIGSPHDDAADSLEPRWSIVEV